MSNSKNSRIGIANLQNGSLCSALKIKQYRVTVTNTCGFDSIASIIACAFVHISYKNTVINNDTEIMQFVKHYVNNGCVQNIYKRRAEILMKIDEFRTEIEKNILTVNCFSNVGNLAQYVFKSNPSYVETKSCDTCHKLTMRKSVLVPLNIDIIKDEGFPQLSKAILGGIPSKRTLCCNKFTTQTIKYGDQIFIEYEPTMQGKVRLSEFPTKIAFNNCSFHLAGVVAHFGTGQNGHYVGYSYQNTEWMEFNDINKKAGFKSADLKIVPNLLIYISN